MLFKGERMGIAYFGRLDLLPEKLYSSVGLDIILGLHETLRKELTLEQLEQTLDDVLPAVSQDVSVFLDQSEDQFRSEKGLEKSDHT